MCSVESVREFVRERITAAAEEISTVFVQTIVQYEEEIDGQRRLLDITSQPQIQLHRIDLPQQHVSEEVEVLADQQLCDQERNSSLDREEPEPSQMNEEQEELFTSQEGEQLGLKQETDTFVLTPKEKIEHSEPEPNSEQDPGGSTMMLVQCTFNFEEILEAQSISKRLTAAVEEIFTVFVKTIDKYEEEIDRQRRLLDVTFNPQVKLHRIALPQQHVSKEEEVLANQQLCDQEEPKPPRMNEEQEELCTSQEGEQLGLNQDTNTFVVTYGENEHSEQLPSPISPASESQDQGGSEHENSGSHSNNTENFAMSKSQCDTDTGKQSLKCDICDKAFKSKYKLSLHMRTHTGQKPYSCKTCGKNFTNHSHLTYHMRKHTGEKPYSCKICGKVFTSSGGLIYHMRTHTGKKPYSCQTCGKNFSSSGSLACHMRIHTGQKPYFCKACGKNFTNCSHLTYHTRKHTGEKPYSCKTCGKIFTSSGGLTYHMRIHTGEKPYCCKTCSKNFSSSDGLSLHMRIHTGEKPYSCKTCDKNFASHSHLTYHMRKHTGEKPYSCKTCGKNFTSSGGLTYHITHTGEKRHSRKTCSKTFTSSSTVIPTRSLRSRTPCEM